MLSTTAQMVRDIVAGANLLCSSIGRSTLWGRTVSRAKIQRNLLTSREGLRQGGELYGASRPTDH